MVNCSINWQSLVFSLILFLIFYGFNSHLYNVYSRLLVLIILFIFIPFPNVQCFIFTISAKFLWLLLLWQRAFCLVHCKVLLVVFARIRVGDCKIKVLWLMRPKFNFLIIIKSVVSCKPNPAYQQKVPLHSSPKGWWWQYHAVGDASLQQAPGRLVEVKGQMKSAVYKTNATWEQITFPGRQQPSTEHIGFGVQSTICGGKLLFTHSIPMQLNRA